MTEYPHSATQEVVEQQQESEGPNRQEEFSHYQERVRQVFEHTSQGRLSEAAELLLRLSHWLLSHVKELGMRVAVEFSKPSD